MAKQISFLDVFRFFICFLTAFFIYIGVLSITLYFEAWNVSEIDLLNLFLNLVLAVALPAFLSILIGLLFISWRYKIVAGVLLLYPIIARRIFDVIYSFRLINLSSDFMPFLGSLIRVSFGMLGALGALYIWRTFKNKRKARNIKYKKEDLQLSKKASKISILLIILSLLSIPATYLAMFVSAFVTIGFCIFLLFLMFSAPRVPAMLVVAVFVAPIFAVWATLKSLYDMYFPKPEFQPAVRLDYREFPSIQNIVEQVCEKVKTRKPNVVILHAEPTFFVMQGKLETFDGVVSGRILALGAPLLRELNFVELKSILAHEFAHFSGRDTLYSTIVSPVYRGIASSLNSIEDVDSKGHIITNAISLLSTISYMFLGIFLEYFATIDMILSRARELRADNIAASLFGKESFATAFKKVIKVSKIYEEKSEEFALSSDENIFVKYNEFFKMNSSDLNKHIDEEMNKREDEFDSHPSLSTRLINLPDIILEDDSLDNKSLVLQDEVKEKEKELSNKYIAQVKGLKEMMDKYLQMLENREKQSKGESENTERPPFYEVREVDNFPNKHLRKFWPIDVILEGNGWKCPSCGEPNDAIYDVCTNCGQEVSKQDR